MWFQRAAAPELIGKPLRTSSFFSLLGHSVASLDGWDACGYNESLWARHAGDPNYNLLNECCIGLSDGANNNALGFSKLAQATMDYLLEKGAGRDAFARYWELIAAAVAEAESALRAAHFLLCVQRKD